MRGQIPGDGKPRLDGDVLFRPGYDMHAKFLSLDLPVTERNGVAASTRFSLTELLDEAYTDPILLFGQVVTGAGLLQGLEAISLVIMPDYDWLQVTSDSRANNGGVLRVCVGYGIREG